MLQCNYTKARQQQMRQEEREIEEREFEKNFLKIFESLLFLKNSRHYQHPTVLNR
jgi:hypothetical protein